MTRLNVVREGEGPIVVLSHALGCDLHMWDGVAAVLARAHTVLRYDHRNHGGSEAVRRPVHACRRWPTMRPALIEREAEGEPVHFVGLSMGGMTAQALAPKHPQLLKSVVIANSSAHYPDAAPWRTRVETVQAQGIAAIAPGAVARWLTPAYVATPEGAEAARALHDTLVGTDAAGYIASCDAVGAIDFRESNRAHRGADAGDRRHCATRPRRPPCRRRWSRHPGRAPRHHRRGAPERGRAAGGVHPAADRFLAQPLTTKDNPP